MAMIMPNDNIVCTFDGMYGKESIANVNISSYTVYVIASELIFIEKNGN